MCRVTPNDGTTGYRPPACSSSLTCQRPAGSGKLEAGSWKLRALVVIFAVPPVSSPGPSSSTLRTTIVVIPARYHSTRLPGKALADIGGRPMIEHVYRRASDARSVAAVIVATDDERIASAVRAFGGDVRMTSASHRSGTDRLAEVAATIECDLVVNVQGDEPLIEPAMIDEAVAPFAAEPELRMSTLRRLIEEPRGLPEPERHEGGRRSRRLCALLLARPDSVRSRGLPGCACVAARRTLRLSARVPAAAGPPRTDRPRTIRGPRTAAGPRARHQNQSQSKRTTTRSEWTLRTTSNACEISSEATRSNGQAQLNVLG